MCNAYSCPRGLPTAAVSFPSCSPQGPSSELHSATSRKGRTAAQSPDSANMYEQVITFPRKLTSRWTEGCYSGKVVNYLSPSSWVEILLPTSTVASWQLDHQLLSDWRGEITCLVGGQHDPSMVMEKAVRITKQCQGHQLSQRSHPGAQL